MQEFELVDDIRHGMNIIYTERWKFSGQLKEDKFHGKCTMTYFDGRIENGEFKEGKALNELS